MLCHCAECQYVECSVLFTVMLNVFMMSVIVMNVVMLIAVMMNVVMLSVITMNVIMLSVITLNVIMLSVVSPEINPTIQFTIKHFTRHGHLFLPHLKVQFFILQQLGQEKYQDKLRLFYFSSKNYFEIYWKCKDCSLVLKLRCGTN